MAPIVSKVGVGFFKYSGFYPDFIMWVKCNRKQHIIFIDPKGLEHTKGLDDEKIIFCTDGIKELERQMNKPKNGGIELSAFVLSITPADKLTATTPKLKKEDYKENNVLFLEDKDWAKQLFEKSVFKES